MTCAAGVAGAQSQDAAKPQDSGAQPQVLFQSHGDSPEPDSDRAVLPATNLPEVTDAERAAIAIDGYDLDAHIAAARAEFSMRARVQVTNKGAVPLSVLPLQISSALRWDSAAVVGSNGQRQTLAVAQHLIDTDADHTGKASEVVLSLPYPLQPGASLSLDVLYSGLIAPNAERLVRIGASPDQAANADWDSISAKGVRLRGFGNVLWYPVASVPLFLGDGNKLFEAVGGSRLANEHATAKLRLAYEYTGAAPQQAFFCGRAAGFTTQTDDATDHDAVSGGVATVEWSQQTIGFREPSLFVVTEKAKPLLQQDAGPADFSSSSASSSTGSLAAPVTVNVAGGDESVFPRLHDEFASVAPMMTEWLGSHPTQALQVVNQSGQPFEDQTLLLAPIDSLASSEAGGAIAHALSHAWIMTGQPWIDEGLGQFFALEWAEREQGRDAATTLMESLVQPLSLGEPSFEDADAVAKAGPGQPLIAARDEMFYRRKAAAVWWMLRDLAGEAELKAALTAWRSEPHKGDAREVALSLQKAIEAATHKEFGWFFQDWVLRDVGLPDLVIDNVTPRPLPAGQGHSNGWLVAVTVKNNGAAAAEVPMVVRSGTFSVTRRIRIAGFSSTTERVLVESAPTEVVVNDGSVPEVSTAMHSRALSIKTDTPLH